MLLGFSLAVLSAAVFKNEPSVTSGAAIIIIFALPLFDTTFSALRRMLSGKSPFSPDRKHLHHRLVDAGLSHKRASLLLSLLGGGFSSLGALVFERGVEPICFILSILLIFAVISVIIISTEKPQGDKKGDENYEKG
jgi:UDP-GlcNAc:undecaprenyl-phosphate GlcNAc-1-phosphate transferase